MLEPSAAAGSTMPPVEPVLSTFLLTDIQGSTRLWEDHPGEMGEALAVHDGLLRSAIDATGGAVVKTMGDGMLAVFDGTVAAVRGAIDAHRGPRDTATRSTL